MCCKTACYELDVPCCESVVLKGIMEASTSYLAVVAKTGKANRYTMDVIADIDGNITIDKSLLPDGFLGTGTMAVWFLDDDAEKVPFTVDGNEYDCMMLNLVNIKKLN